MIPDFENLTGIDVVLDEMEEGFGQKLTQKYPVESQIMM